MTRYACVKLQSQLQGAIWSLTVSMLAKLDDDSTYGSVGGASTSINSEAMAFPIENGRRYHAYQSESMYIPSEAMSPLLDRTS